MSGCIVTLCCVLLFNGYFVSAEKFCPSPVAENIGVDSKTRERFDALRKSIGNELSVKHIHHEHHQDEFNYFINLCSDTNNSWAINQIDEKSGGTKTVGRHDSASVLLGAEDWLFIQYKNGDHYGHHCNKQAREGWISIRCEDRGEKPTLRVIEEARGSTSDPSKNDKLCYYLFEYNHPAACSPKHKGALNGGAVFCIIVIIVFSAYLVFGFLYQRFVMRASGLEQIPHYSFWRMCGNRMADGCDFVCRSEETPQNQYKGITDDLGMESSDEERDEGLLPM